MKRIISLFIISLFLNLSLSNAANGLPASNKILSFEENNKIVINLSGVDTEGVQLQIFSADGELIENKLLQANANLYAINKPEKGIYWLYLKKGIDQAYQRIKVN